MAVVAQETAARSRLTTPCFDWGCGTCDHGIPEMPALGLAESAGDCKSLKALVSSASGYATAFSFVVGIAAARR